MDKVVATAALAVADITGASPLAVGEPGFGGMPDPLILTSADTGEGEPEHGSEDAQMLAKTQPPLVLITVGRQP